MKAVALLLLCSCAPVATAIPSSLPYVRVDATLPGAVMSRGAAIVVATKRVQDRTACDLRITDCEARATSAERSAAFAAQLTDEVARWRTWGPIGIVIAAVLAFTAGAAVGFSAKR